MVRERGIAIVGGTLSAAFAWRACLDAGMQPDVFAALLAPPEGGTAWVSWLPSSVDQPQYWRQIHLRGVGTADAYSEKMQGVAAPDDFPTGRTTTLRGVGPVQAARALWGDDEIYERLHVGAVSAARLAFLQRTYDAVIVADPMVLTPQVTPVWAAPNATVPTNYVLYLSEPHDEMVRASNLFRWRSLETPPIARATIDQYPDAFLSAKKIAFLRGIEDVVLRFIPEGRERASVRDGNTLYLAPEGTTTRSGGQHRVYDETLHFLRGQGLARLGALDAIGA